VRYGKVRKRSGVVRMIKHHIAFSIRLFDLVQIVALNGRLRGRHAQGREIVGIKANVIVIRHAP
jgi:hypothetical protein